MNIADPVLIECVNEICKGSTSHMALSTGLSCVQPSILFAYLNQMNPLHK
jgi:hypothetical protein